MSGEPIRVSVDGQSSPIEFPFGTAPEVIQKAMAETFGTRPEGAPVEEDLQGDMLNSIANMPTEISDALAEYGNPDTFTSEAIEGDMRTQNPITAGANVILPASKALGAISKAGYDTWWATYGQALPEGSKAAVASGFEALATGVIAKWKDFSADYPLEATMLEDTGTVVGAFSPKIKIPGLKGTELSQRSIANTKKIEARRKGIFGMVRKKDSQGPIEESGTASGRHQQWEPDMKEENMAGTLETIDKVDPNRSYTFNTKRVQESVKGWKDALWKRLGTHHQKFTEKSSVLAKLDESLEDITQVEGYHALSGDAQTAFAKQMQEARRLITEAGTKNKLRPRDLLTIRQKFDKLFTDGGGSLEKSTTDARNMAARELRDLLNKELRDVTGDPHVYDLLDRQHEGLNALKVLEPKRAKEQSNMFYRTAQKFKDAGHLPSTPLALYATAGVAAGFGAPVIATAAATAATGVAAYKIYQGLKGPARNQALAKLLAEINTASRKDASFASSIATERAMLIEMMKETQRDESEE